MTTRPDRKIVLLVAAGYAVSAALALGLGFVAISAMLRLHATSTNLYVHPFTVSNAALDVRASALLLRNQMLQLAVAEPAEKIDALAAQTVVLGEDIRKNLAVVREGFLGDIEKVREVERLLRRWDRIREQTVALARGGERERALALIAGENTVVFDDLFEHIAEIVRFARQRAADFSLEAEQEATEMLRLTGVLLAVLVAVIGLAGLTVVRLVSAKLQRQRQMEAGLRRSEERWHFALEGAGDGVWDWNVATGEVLFSQRFCEMLGYTEIEMGGRLENWQNRVHPDDLPAAMRNVEACFDGRTAQYVAEFRMRCKDGSWKWVLARGMVVGRDEGSRPLRMIGTHTDITERKLNEAALQESRSHLAGIIDSAMNAIITIDAMRNILVFNHAAEVMFKVGAGTAVGGSIDRFIPERFRDSHRALVLGFGASGATKRAMGRPGEVRGLRADGEEFAAEAAISRIVVGNKQLFTVVLSDLTDRHAAEQARHQLEGQLRQSQKLEAMGTLAGGIAHDFNNILGAILGNIELARQDLGDDHPALASLEQIEKSGQRARSLVQQILLFSRRQPQEFQTLSLAKTVPECVKLLRATLPAGVALEHQAATAPLYMRGDPAQLHQVMMNLCINAWQAIGERAGRIDIHVDELTLDAAAAAALPGLQPGRHARLTVRDDGQGMDEVTRSRIFEPFFTTKPVDCGTGLGLAVVHGIVEAHHGAIAVRSTPGAGTTFELYFPLVEVPDDTATPSCPSAAKGAGQHVLYLDDDETMTLLATRMLERWGYRVTPHRDAEQALAAVRADPRAFDLVVTDYNMPRLSGVEVAAELARIRPALPVLLISGYLTDELQQAAQKAGVRHIICKANTVEELCPAVEQVLRGHVAAPADRPLTAA